MASPCLLLKICCLVALFHAGCASRTIPAATGATAADTAGQQQLLRYHKGALLRGNITVNLIWYGKFTPSQRTVVADFITSLSVSVTKPSVADWWGTLEKYYHLAGKPNSMSLKLGRQVLDESYSLGKSLSEKHIVQLASMGGRTHPHAVNVVLTAANVTVEGFCVNRCGTHGFRMKWVYIWVGNSDPLCPGYCAWPFHRPVYGPQTPPLVAPNNDVGLDGVVMSLSGLLAGTATNPYGNGYFQGPADAPLEATTACTGVYGKGAYPGYPGKLLADQTTGASYNAHGVNGRKYLLPALYDPATSKCSTLV